MLRPAPVADSNCALICAIFSEHATFRLSLSLSLLYAMMYLSSVETQSATELRHTAATISYAGQLLLGPPHAAGYESKGQVHGHSFATVADLQSVYDLQMEQRWSVQLYLLASILRSD